LVLHSPRVQSGKWLPLCLFQKSWKPKLNNPPYHFLYFFLNDFGYSFREKHLTWVDG
jgi:hypothetical protein